jgi:4-hydroxymandelate synthase
MGEHSLPVLISPVRRMAGAPGWLIGAGKVAAAVPPCGVRHMRCRSRTRTRGLPLAGHGVMCESGRRAISPFSFPGLSGGSAVVAQDVEYAELYTADKSAAVDYFVSSMGFAVVAESTARTKDTALLRQGNVQLLVTAGYATREFLDSHGDGIADVALACDDVAVTADAAVAAGGRVDNSVPERPAISAFGGTVHTLLPAQRRPASRLPPGRSWITKSPVPGRPDGRITKLDHLAICLGCGTLDSWTDFYGDAFGFARYSSEYVEAGETAMDSVVVRSRSGRVTFTLVAPVAAKAPGQLEAFLDRNGGPGVQHLAFGVENIVAAAREARRRGVEFLRAPAAYYDMLADRLGATPAEIAALRSVDVLADRDEWGELLQLFTHSPYQRNTLFYEFIERRGARGFGSANIRALFEAVERDRLAAG